MDTTFRAGRIAGIEIGVNWTWFAIFGLIVWTLSQSIFPSENPDLGNNTYIAMGAIAAVAFFQWGLTAEFYWVVAVYTVIQILDGNVLVPLLFSEAVNLHPVAIIIAVLFFGGIWGFWGVFFAIPLATFIKAVIYAWPSRVTPDEDTAAA